MFDSFLHKYYSATVSFAVDGTMVVASTRERVLIWGMTFCFAAAVCLAAYLIWRRRNIRRVSLLLFTSTLVIPAIIMPAAGREYIEITPRALTIDTGAWIRDSRTVISFDGLVRIREERDGRLPGNLIGDPDVYWNLYWSNGRVTRLDLNAFCNAHRMVLAHYIRDRGYFFERLEDRSFSVFPWPGTDG